MCAAQSGNLAAFETKTMHVAPIVVPGDDARQPIFKKDRMKRDEENRDGY
jgi:hypothetical protein